MVRATAFGLSALPLGLLAQETTAPNPGSTAAPDEDIVVLDPFVVEAEENAGYQATSTLAGTRVRTDLRDIASPLSVVTQQFLQDTGSRSNQELLQYTTNTEVGGIYGNYGGFGNGQGLSESSALMRPNENTRVRGLEQADGTRNFFLSDIPWDSYNTDRIDIQRGPNSILFGVGSPAGIINASPALAQLGADSGKVEVELSSFGAMRQTFDYNKVVAEDLLAVRVAALNADKKFRQEEAFNEDQRVYGTFTFQPQVLNSAWAGRLSVRGMVEAGEIVANNPRVLPPDDGITLWFDDAAGDGVVNPWGVGKALYDTYLMEAGGFGSADRGLNGSVLDAFYVPAYTSIDGGALNNGGVAFFYRNGESNPFLASRQAPRVYPGGIGSNGQRDTTVSGIPYGSNMRSAGWNAYAQAVNKIDLREGRPSRFPFADRNYYKDRSLTDPSVFNFYNHLIDGNNKREKADWDAQNLALSQTFFDNRFGVEFVYDLQSYKESRNGVAWERPYIAVDMNMNLQSQFPQYERVDDPTSADPADTVIDRSTYRVPGFSPSAAQPYANPNAGAAFVAGGANGNFSTEIERKSTRLTAFGEFRASDVLDRESTLARVLGRHLFTGLLSSENRNYTDARWRNISMDLDWARSLSVNGEDTKIGNSTREIVPIVYLSGPLTDSSITSARGLKLGPVTTVINPSGEFVTEYFNSTWNRSTNPSDPTYVNPADPFVNMFGEQSTDVGFQSENPANYVGWTRRAANVLNARTGDIDALYTDYTVRDQDVDSIGATWQGHLFEGTIVPTVGWRRDKLVTYTGVGAKSESGVASTHAPATTKALENEGDTTSWGIVAHLPREWADKLPVLSGVSAFYNRGKNNKVEARYNFDGEPLPNPTADSTDYGVVLSALEDRLSVKISRYETKVKNGNLPGGASLIGANQYYINQLEAWGTASALIDYFGYHGLDPNQNWYWNWAWVDSGFDSAIQGLDPRSAAYRNHPSTVAQQEAVADFIAGMNQQFYDNYQIPIDVAKLQAAYASGDVQQVVAAVAGVFPVGSYATTLTSLNNGQINGISPNGTIDNTSKGYEIEVNFKPKENWDLQVNASKTTAYREALGAPMREFINDQYARYSGAAGDLRIWWAGEKSIKEFYEDNIISALTFQEESIGHQAPELRPWRFAAISNYRFTSDWLKGFNMGGAWRWEDRQILGYGLKDDLSGLDVNKPIRGETESSIDLWFGYNYKISEAVRWRIQLNLRNVGESKGLTPISANPDGTVAAQRITEGMTWALTNSFSF